MNYSREVLAREMKKISLMLGLAGLDIKVSTRWLPDKYEAIREDYDECSYFKDGYVIRFNMKNIKKAKLDEYQLRCIIVHELLHIFPREYDKQMVQEKRTLPIQDFKLKSGDLLRRLGNFEEFVVDLTTFRYCLSPMMEKGFGEAFCWDLRRGKYRNMIDYLNERLKEIYKDLKKDINDALPTSDIE